MEKSKTQIVAAVTHELVKGERFFSLTDLSEAVKCSCAKLKIPYNSLLVSAAIRQVLLQRPTALATRTHPAMASVKPTSDGCYFSRAEAARLYQELLARCHVTAQPAQSTVGRPANFPDLVRVSR